MVSLEQLLSEGSLPVPLKKNGKFFVPWEVTTTPPSGLDKFLHLLTPRKATKKFLSSVVPDLENWKMGPSDGVRATWLGHACVLLQYRNVNLLTDPHLSTSRHRVCDPPCRVLDLPPIQMVILSNPSPDHLDENTLCELTKLNPDMIVFAPKGFGPTLRSLKCRNVVELTWWKQRTVTFIEETMKGMQVCHREETAVQLVFCPSQSMADTPISGLWGSWIVYLGEHRLFFVGSTGYCPVYKTIGNLFGPIHLAAIPIGGYFPEFLQRYSHVTPEDAVLIHKDIQSEYSLGISWGTFEGPPSCMDPPHRLAASLEAWYLNPLQFSCMKQGESRIISVQLGEENWPVAMETKPSVQLGEENWPVAMETKPLVASPVPDFTAHVRQATNCSDHKILKSRLLKGPGTYESEPDSIRTVLDSYVIIGGSVETDADKPGFQAPSQEHSLQIQDCAISGANENTPACRLEHANGFEPDFISTADLSGGVQCLALDPPGTSRKTPDALTIENLEVSNLPGKDDSDSSDEPRLRVELSSKSQESVDIQSFRKLEPETLIVVDTPSTVDMTSVCEHVC